jgi:hypothetical protein
MYGIGAIIGPLVASTAMTVAGATALFVYTAAIHGLLVLYAAYRMIRRESVPKDKHISFSDALTRAVTASQVCEVEIGHQAPEKR